MSSVKVENKNVGVSTNHVGKLKSSEVDAKRSVDVAKRTPGFEPTKKKAP